MAETLEGFIKERQRKDPETDFLGALRVLDPESPAVKLGAKQVDESSSMDDLKKDINDITETFSTLGYETGSLISWVPPRSQSSRLCSDPSVEIFLYDREDQTRVEDLLSRLDSIEDRVIEEYGEDTENLFESLRNYHQVYGELLGYPECDTEFFAADAGPQNSSTMPENQTMVKGFESGVWEDLLSRYLEEGITGIVDNPPKYLFSIPTESFYPCDIECSSAIEMGRRVDGNIDDTEARDFYRAELFYNHLLMLSGARMVLLSDENEKIEQGLESIKSVDEEASDVIDKMADIRSRGGYEALFDAFMTEYRHELQAEI